jgi:hypothetical protein
MKRAMETVVETQNFGLMFEFAQRIRTRIGEGAWVVPGNGFICVMGGQPIVAGCNTTSETIKHGMSVVAIELPLARYKAKRYLLFGVAPDRAKEVTIRVEHGKRDVVLVVNNVYSYRASAMIYATLIR